MCLPTCARVVCLALTRAISADSCRYSRASRSLGTPSFQDQPVGWSGTGHTTGKNNFVRTLNGQAHSALQKTVRCGPITSLIRWAQQSIGAVEEGRESEGVESGACRAYSLLAFDHAQLMLRSIHPQNSRSPKTKQQKSLRTRSFWMALRTILGLDLIAFTTRDVTDSFLVTDGDAAAPCERAGEAIMHAVNFWYSTNSHRFSNAKTVEASWPHTAARAKPAKVLRSIYTVMCLHAVAELLQDTHAIHLSARHRGRFNSKSKLLNFPLVTF
jgi:hypothetical protein